MKLIIKIIKRITIAFAIIYSFNILASSFNINLGVNPFSIGIVSLLGVPGMISLVILRIIIK